MSTIRARGSPGGEEPVQRWECRCRVPPVLLGTFDRNGRINIKVRDRYWHVEGIVRTTCPRCGVEHVLDLRRDQRTGTATVAAMGSA
jgi:hypothetical protein